MRHLMNVLPIGWIDCFISLLAPAPDNVIIALVSLATLLGNGVLQINDFF